MYINLINYKKWSYFQNTLLVIDKFHSYFCNARYVFQQKTNIFQTCHIISLFQETLLTPEISFPKFYWQSFISQIYFSLFFQKLRIPWFAKVINWICCNTWKVDFKLVWGLGNQGLPKSQSQYVDAWCIENVAVHHVNRSCVLVC